MKRKCVKINLENFIDESNSVFDHLKLISVEIYIDAKNMDSVVEFLLKNKRKFRSIVYYILQGKYNDSLYRKENISEKAKNITAMKFSGKLNTRIYCKEFFLVGGKKIVAIEFLENKGFQKANNKNIKSKLESIGGYEYEFE